MISLPLELVSTVEGRWGDIVELWRALPPITVMLSMLVDRLAMGYAWMVANPIQVIGTVFGIGGALMLAIKCRMSAWAWPAWIVSNAAWTWYAFHLPETAYGLIAQQVVFGVINVVGTWTWMFRRQPAQLASNGAT